MTPILRTASPVAAGLPGIAHATWAGRAEGLEQLSIWKQSLAPGATTPPHVHDCDEVVICESGEGELVVDGAVHRFVAGEIVILPRGHAHQLRNAGSTTLELLAAFGATPVGTTWPGGEPLPLPWRT